MAILKDINHENMLTLIKDHLYDVIIQNLLDDYKAINVKAKLAWKNNEDIVNLVANDILNNCRETEDITDTMRESIKRHMH